MSSGYEEQELTAIGAALDANPDATSSEVFQATRPFDERAIASVAASRALAGGGGSQPGVARVLGPFPFAHNTPGLNDGVAFYTPTIGDVLLDLWISITTVFNGTTPLLDVGTFVGNTYGLFAWNILPASAGNADDVSAGAGLQSGGAANDLRTNVNALSAAINGAEVSGTAIVAKAGGIGNLGGQRVLPALFTAANPLKVVVSQDGLAGGLAVGGTEGAGNVYVVVATPSLT